MASQITQQTLSIYTQELNELKVSIGTHITHIKTKIEEFKQTSKESVLLSKIKETFSLLTSGEVDYYGTATKTAEKGPKVLEGLGKTVIEQKEKLGNLIASVEEDLEQLEDTIAEALALEENNL
jgi:hypothetical protein